MKKTALIILNYNNSRDTRNCIESIQRCNTAPVKYVVVDNASNPQERDALKSVLTDLFPEGYGIVDGANPPDSNTCLPECTLVLNDKNLGYACGNNSGLNFTRYDDEIDKLMILNNDILFVEDIIPALSGMLSELPHCGLLSPVLYKKGMREYDLNCARKNVRLSRMITDNFLFYYYQWRNMGILDIDPDMFILLGNPPKEGIIEVELPSGSCMLIYKSLFEKIGYFDPNTFLYLEENILYKKLSALGYKNYVSLDNKCIHLGAASTKKISGSAWLMRKAKQSEKYYVKTYSGASLPSRILYSLSLNFFLFTLSMQKTLKKMLTSK